jgi:hypothetical protein
MRDDRTTEEILRARAIQMQVDEILRTKNHTSGRLSDLGFTLTASDYGFEVKHADGFGHGWSYDYYPDIRRTLELFLDGIETGVGLTRRGVPVTTSRDRYDEAMREAFNTYADVIGTLRVEVNVNFDITQTGGMCLAIECPLPDQKKYILITDYEEILPWDRAEQRGWTVGAYDWPDPDDEYDAESFEEVFCAEGTGETDTATMIAAVKAWCERHGA